jgi:hypothetical protein
MWQNATRYKEKTYKASTLAADVRRVLWAKQVGGGQEVGVARRCLVFFLSALLHVRRSMHRVEQRLGGKVGV